MTEVRRSKSGIPYLHEVLGQTARTITEAVLCSIPHHSSKEHLGLKVARYSLSAKGRKEALESQAPKSQIWLQRDEFDTLIRFLQENYEPFSRGIRRYVPVDGPIDEGAVEALKSLLANPDKHRLLAMLADTSILPEDLFLSLQHSKRVKAVETFEQMLQEDLPEQGWQVWLKANSWVLGTEFVKILDDRAIDLNSISDYLMQAYDGFVDIVEIKRPGGGLRFWADKQDHGNYYPSTDLTKAIIQSIQYIFDVERRTNDLEFMERIGRVKVIKPRCVLLFGRSSQWNESQREAYRVLNSSFHDLTILTYDHVLARAKRMLGIDGVEIQRALRMDPLEVTS